MKEFFYHNQTSYNLAKELDFLKNYILQRWENDRISKIVLEQKGIDSSFFVKYFGSKILDYFIQILSQKAEIGQCPIIIVMFKFFEKKNLNLNDLFLCYSAMKNAVVDVYCENKNSNNRFNINELKVIQTVFDLNFAGVIQEFLKCGDIVDICNSEDTFKNSSIKLQISDEKICKELDKEIVKFEQQVARPTEYDSYELQEFLELEEEISYYTELLAKNSLTVEASMKFSSRLVKYAHTISGNPIFKALSQSIFDLAHIFSDRLGYDKVIEKSTEISTLMDCFVNDLVVWRKSLSDKDTKDTNFYDQSIICNVSQIVQIVKSADDANHDDGCEFF